MTEWQWLQLGLQVGIAVGQLGILLMVARALNSKVEKLTERHYEHTKEVAEKYVKKEDLKDLFRGIKESITFMHNDLMRRLEKLEERSHERKG